MTFSHWIRVLRNHPRPSRLVAARFLQWIGLSPLLTVKLDGYRLRFYPTNVSATLWINPEGRFHGLELFRDYCQPGDVSVDVGANVGEVSITLSQRAGATGHDCRDRRCGHVSSHPVRRANSAGSLIATSS